MASFSSSVIVFANVPKLVHVPKLKILYAIDKNYLVPYMCEIYICRVFTTYGNVPCSPRTSPCSFQEKEKIKANKVIYNDTVFFFIFPYPEIALTI